MLPNLPTEIFNGQEFTVFKGIANARLFLVHTLDEWNAFYGVLKTKQFVAFDTETTGFSWHGKDHVVGLSFGWDDIHCYVPVRHEYSVLKGDPPQQIDIADIKDDLKEFFGDSNRTVVGWNSKFDMHFIHKEGIDFNCKVEDGMILWHLLDENAPKALKIVASGWKDEMGRLHKGVVDGAANIKEKELDLFRSKESKARRTAFRTLVMTKADELDKQIEHQGKTRNQLKKYIAENLLQEHIYAKAAKDDVHYGVVPITLMCEYAALDTFLTYKIYEHCMKNLNWSTATKALYKNETELLRVLYDAEEEGVKVDRNYLIPLGKDLDQQIKELHKEIQLVLGDINLNSTNNLADALLKNGVNLTKLTEKSTETNKKFALDKKVLEKLKVQHEIVNSILELRSRTKTKSTYVDGILELLNADDILHCSFNQNVTTGRLSCRAPNLQNIPASDKTIRRAFISPSDEYVFVFADYSQIEVRLTAHYSQDPLLLDAYAKNQDIHTRSMCEMFDHEYDFAVGVLKDSNNPMYEELSYLRSTVKRLVFGIIYGVGGPGLSEQIQRPDRYKLLDEKAWIRVCQDYIDQYLNKYVGVKRFINQSGRLIAKDKEITNYFGRVRRLPHADACRIYGDRKWFWLEAKAKRQGTNHLVQSSAADMFKIACVRVHKLLQGKKSKLVNFVHDEIQIYLHKDELYLLNDIKHAMENWNFTVPIIAEFSWSKTNWAEKKAIK